MSEIISALALILSGIATWRTFRFNKRQEALIESQDKLNALYLKKEENDATNEKKANLGVSLIRLGGSHHRLKVWNKGPAVATNVHIEFPEGNELVPESEIDEKFPLECLDSHQSVELVAAVHMGTKRKQLVRLIWEDSSEEHNEKVFYPTL